MRNGSIDEMKIMTTIHPIKFAMDLVLLPKS
jgi:hypothetical protein